MYRQVMTLIRGVAHDAEEEFSDRNALLILRQQIRDAAQTVGAARKAVAVAIAQNTQETAQQEKLATRIADLENRAILALEQDKPDLAREAAEMIAILEAERDASETSQQQFSREIGRLRANVASAEMRLRELQRGQRIASAADTAQRLRTRLPQTGFSALSEAEATLKRLRHRQERIDLAAEAMAELGQSACPRHITEKLAEAGCGKPIKSSANAVLARLTDRAADRSNENQHAIEQGA